MFKYFMILSFVTLIAGKMFSNKNSLSCSNTPVAGIGSGKLNGITTATIDWVWAHADKKK